MYRLSLVCLFGLVLTTAFVSPTYCYARVAVVKVYASSPVSVDEQVTVRTDIHTGNNVRERVTDVQAMLILPEGANLTSEVNPIFIGEMGPGPADASCNWTVVFDQPGIYTVMVNVSCVDTQYMPRWLMNSTTVEVYDFPHVEFAYSGNVYVNQTVVFNATESRSRAPGGWIVCYQWDFGDGKNITTSESMVEHAFSAVGNYNVFLNVTDSRGLSSVKTANIRISLLGDINLDRVINILDISIVAYSFGSQPGNEKWNAESDLNGDNTIDISDVSLVAMEYGKTA